MRSAIEGGREREMCMQRGCERRVCLSLRSCACRKAQSDEKVVRSAETDPRRRLHLHLRNLHTCRSFRTPATTP